jgi:hypothetical protein
MARDDRDDEHEGTASPDAKPPPEPQHSVHSEPEEPADDEDGSPEPERRD